MSRINFNDIFDDENETVSNRKQHRQAENCKGGFVSNNKLQMQKSYSKKQFKNS